MRLMVRVAAILALAFLLLSASERIPSFTLSGLLKESNSLRLTPQTLTESLPLQSVALFDPYLKHDIAYEGVPLGKFVAHYGKPTTQKLLLRAVDNYVVEITRAEWEKEQILLVLKANGNWMTRKEYGPAKIVYPNYDQRMRGERTHFIKWIWMISTIEFLP